MPQDQQVVIYGDQQSDVDAASVARLIVRFVRLRRDQSEQGRREKEQAAS